MSAAVGSGQGRDLQREAAKRRRERVAIGVVAALVVGLTLLEANLATLGGAVGLTSNVVIFALINLNVILVVLLIFLVTRNVFKLILDRRRKILGARIRSRLVLIFILFSLVPTVLLFVAAANITTTSIKSWIGSRVGVALTGALDVARKGLADEARSAAAVAERAARAVPRGAGPSLAGTRLARARKASGTGVSLLLLGPAGIVAASGDVPPEVASEVLKLVRGARLDGARAGGRTFVGEMFAAAAHGTADGRIVVAVRILSPKDTARVREIRRAYDEYHQVRLLDDPIRASYIYVLVLITLLIVFAASWMGIYLARQITVPVQLLAEGTERVASGDLDVRVDYRSDDEIGTLVSSFNRMTADLREMKANLEGANVSLSSTYEELRRRTRFIETILTNISTGVIVIDRVGRVAMINRVAERILGIKTEKVLGMPYKEVVREEHYETVRALSRQVGETAGKPVERQIDLAVGGKRITLRVSVTALQDDRGEYSGLVVAFDDLSQAMRLQKVLAWREVARRIAHEIRNPLTPIQLSTERLRKKFEADHAGDPAFSESTQTILSEVGSLKHLVDEFTRFARMPAPVFKEGRIQDDVRQVVETFRSAHPGIRWEIVEDDVPPAWFDPFQMRRAVTNLLENAASALSGGGTVTVGCVHDPEAGLVRVTVADDGPGVTQEDRDRLFEPYFSRRQGGTGLGLAIVSAIVSDHDGTVRVRDNAPRGAIFEIEFPIRAREGG
ncbi:MAG: ATP-binding protein [Gemmatimonadota bacterium]